MTTTIDYKAAGVDIAAGNEAVKRIKHQVESTFSPHVLTGIGQFGAMYDLHALLYQYRHPVLVQSIDGVGTKMMVASRMKKFDTIGIDLVSATANDIIVLGATPLTLLDYIANDQLKPEVVEEIISGMVKACRENDISLIGGETAEMPGTYLKGEHDLVGVITGVVEKDDAILGKDIVPGDIVLGLASSGLHTNGYSLARKLLFDVAALNVDSYLPELTQSVGEALLVPHLNYTKPVKHLLQHGIRIKGMAHITGGGLLENIPRILPRDCAVELRKGSWPTQAIFELLKSLGSLSDTDYYRTFNAGIGLVLIISPERLSALHDALNTLPSYALYEIGQVVSGQQSVSITSCA